MLSLNNIRNRWGFIGKYRVIFEVRFVVFEIRSAVFEVRFVVFEARFAVFGGICPGSGSNSPDRESLWKEMSSIHPGLISGCSHSSNSQREETGGW